MEANEMAAFEARIDAKSLELAATVRSANETLKDLRTAIREGREFAAELRGLAAKSADDEIAKAVSDGLAKFGEALDKAIADSTQSVFDRFDTITETLLGETKREMKAGTPSIPELAEAVGTLNRADRRKMRKRGR